MPIVPIPTTLWDFFWLAYRTAMQIVFVIGFIVGLRIVARHTRMVKDLLAVVQSKEHLLAELKVKASELADRTAQVVAASEARDAELKKQMEENTSITREAALAAKDAYHVANNLNQKIARTSEQIEKIVSSPAAGHLEHIDRNTAAIAKNTEKE